MNEFVTKYLKPLLEFWKKLSKKLKIIIIASVVGVIALAIIITAILGRKVYVPLYSNMTPTDSQQVLAALGQTAIDYKVADNGATILVEKSAEPAARAQLAISGHPKATPNYDFFLNNVDFMTTESERRTYSLYQMQLNMQAAIETIQGINTAIVTITPPEENTYAWDTSTYTPTGTVVLGLSNGVTLEPSQVAGVKRIVAGSNIGLTVDNVSVVDNNGNELKSSDDMSYIDINNFKLDIEKQFENAIKTNIMNAIAPVYGKQNITVSAKSKMDFDKKVKEIITHTPSNEDGKGIISESNSEKEQIKNNTEGNVAGEEANTEPDNYAGVEVDENTIAFKDYESYKYAVNQATEQITSDVAALSDLTVTVSIDKRMRDIPTDERESVISAIANAAGVSPAKVALLNTEFLQVDPVVTDQGGLSNLLLLSIAGGSLLLVVILVVVLILSKRMKKKRLATAQLAEGGPAVPGEDIVIPVGDSVNMEEDLRNTPESREHALRKEIQDFSSKNPQIVAQLIKTWLRGDNDE